MKLIKLLSRYLFRSRSRRDRRRRTGPFGAHSAALTATDVVLERRVLLSGVACAAESSNTSIAIGGLKVHPDSSPAQDRNQPTSDSFLVANSDQDGAVFQSGTATPSSGSGSAGGGQIVISAADKITPPARAATDRLLNVNNSQGLVVDRLSPELDSILGDLPFVTKEPFPTVEQSIALDRLLSPAESSDSSTEFSSREMSGTSSLRTQNPSADSRQFRPTLLHAQTDALFSLADSAAWAVDLSDDLPTTDVTVSTTRGAFVRSQIRSQQQDPQEIHDSGAVELRNLLSLNGTGVSNVQASEFSVAGASRSAVAQVLDTFVQLVTAEFSETDDEDLTHWLRQQLGLIPIDGGSSDIDVSHVADTYADSNSVADRQNDHERQQEAWLKVSRLSHPDVSVTNVSHEPPERPDIVGVWKRLEFSCNPRGPPVSDRLPGSEFTRQSAHAMQLEQLRYSIAPRGPCEASVI